MVDVSIIIVNYNGFDLLKNCLNTLYNYADGFYFEVILIDNNSIEGDIEEVVKGYDKVKLIKNKINLGFSRANNVGLNLAQGKYVLFLNNDVYFTENSIKKIFDFVEGNNEKTFIGCKLLNPDKSWQTSTANFPSLLNFLSSNFFLYMLFPSSAYFNKYYLQKKKIEIPIEVDYVLGAF